MRDLDSQMIARLYGSLPETGTTRAVVSRTLHAALEEAVELDLLARNPARLSRKLRPRYVPVKGDAPYWDEDEAMRFLTVLAELPSIKVGRGELFGFFGMYELCLLDLFSGLRLGELLGLEWDRVDLDSGILVVDEQLTVEGGRLTLKPYLKGGRPGGRFGRRKARTIHIEKPAVDALARWRKVQATDHLAAKDWQATHTLAPDGEERPNVFVFTCTDGRPVHPSTFEGWFRRAVEAAGVTPLTPHGMRHSHAAILLRNGWHMHDVSARLGHAASTVTETCYAHIDASRASRAPRRWQRCCRWTEHGRTRRRPVAP